MGEVAKTNCGYYHVARYCKKSCGLCPGMTPAKSMTCFDRCPFCVTAKYHRFYCSDASFADMCKARLANVNTLATALLIMQSQMWQMLHICTGFADHARPDVANVNICTGFAD